MKLRNRNAGPALAPPFEGHGPDGAERATFAAGCFWGVEAGFRQIHGVLQTAAGYTGGHVPDPSYERVCRHRTGHAEAVEVWFDPAQVSYAQLLQVFWRIHNPTTRNRQGFDFGSQYRSAIFYHDAGQQEVAIASRDAEQPSLRRQIITQIAPASAFNPKLPPSRLVDAFDQVVEPLITEITCLRSHERRLFHLVSAYIGAPLGGTTV
ncbi:MAG: peptide-methionine (S)-S-oxide reductase MsrA [Streptosporangiaceae bacterium]